MKVWVCNTLTSIFYPMLGTARLYAYLKNKGYDIVLKDFNQNAFFHMLSKKYLEGVFVRLEDKFEPATRSKFLRENLGSILLNSSNNGFRAIIGSKIDNKNIYYALLGQKDFLISRIDAAREALDKEFLGLSPEDFLAHFKTILCGKALIDAAYFPAQLDFGFGFHGAMYSPRAGDIIRAVKDEQFNFLIPYYNNEVMPLLEKERPGLVGISITHTADLVPVFTLAHLIKSKHPDIHICLGGATLTEIAYRLEKNLKLWDFFDSLILGPAENTFGELIERVGKRENLAAIPNTIYREGGSIKKSEKVCEFDLNEACAPEFVSLRPKSILPLEASSGCYWGKCIFCYYPRMGTSGITAGYENKRVRNIELVIDDLKKLQERYDPSYVGLIDASTSPHRLEKIVEYNLKAEKKIPFSAFIRFEKEFTSPSFCDKLAKGGFLGGQIGLESGSQRVNDIINKGVNIKDAETIIRNFHRAGILMHVYCVVGVPGETKKNALMTYKFLKRWHRLIGLGWQIFSLYVLEHGPLAERANEFGLKAHALPDDYLAQVMNYELKDGMSQAESINLTIQYHERLKRYMHPLRHIMDVETYKAVIVAFKAKGVGPAAEDIG